MANEGENLEELEACQTEDGGIEMEFLLEWCPALRVPFPYTVIGDEMRIEHIALWTENLEGLKDFYKTYFEARSAPKYANLQKDFQSYFIIFSSGARLELMSIPGLQDPGSDPNMRVRGYTTWRSRPGPEWRWIS